MKLIICTLVEQTELKQVFESLVRTFVRGAKLYSLYRYFFLHLHLLSWLFRKFILRIPEAVQFAVK